MQKGPLQLAPPSPGGSRSDGWLQLGAATDIGDRITEHMDVIASDGVKIGIVDHLDGQDKIKLARTTAPNGQHHYIPLAWVDHVDTHVHLTKASAEARAAWW
jgi:hypothetical protein